MLRPRGFYLTIEFSLTVVSLKENPACLRMLPAMRTSYTVPAEPILSMVRLKTGSAEFYVLIPNAGNIQRQDTGRSNHINIAKLGT